MKKSLLFIMNPHAGKKTLKSKLCDLINLFITYDFHVEVYVTQAPKDAIDIMRTHGHAYDLCICSGGDGSLNEMIQACMQMDYKKPIGYIPSGTINDFAANLKLSKNPITCANQIMRGSPHTFDVGTINNLHFIYIAAFGSISSVSYNTPQLSKNILGHSAYLIEGMKQLLDLKKYRLRIEYDDEVIKDTFCYGMITNSLSIGGMHFFDEGDIDVNDGYFECLFIKYPNNPLDYQQIMQAFISHDLQKCARVYLFKAKRIKIHSRSDIPWAVDGEFGGHFKDVDVVNLHSAIQIIK